MALPVRRRNGLRRHLHERKFLKDRRTLEILTVEIFVIEADKKVACKGAQSVPQKMTTHWQEISGRRFIKKAQCDG